jgi:hypothetical protein
MACLINACCSALNDVNCRDQMHAEGKEHLVEEMLLAIEKVWGYR